MSRKVVLSRIDGGQRAGCAAGRLPEPSPGGHRWIMGQGQFIDERLAAVGPRMILIRLDRP